MNTSSTQNCRSAVLTLLQWTETEWTGFQFDSGEEYLARAFAGMDEDHFQAIRLSATFWRWWVNQWDFRDECFADYAGVLSPYDRVLRYRKLHSPASIKNRPHKIILEAIHMDTVAAFETSIKQLLC